MFVKNSNFLDIVIHKIAKNKILNKLKEKDLTSDDIRFINRIIDINQKITKYNVILKNENFTIFHNSSELQ